MAAARGVRFAEKSLPARSAERLAPLAVESHGKASSRRNCSGAEPETLFF